MPDGQVLARLIGAVILVINAGGTPAATVERVVAELGPECILGTVLNRVEEHRIPEAGYYARYGYGHGGADERMNSRKSALVTPFHALRQDFTE